LEPLLRKWSFPLADLPAAAPPPEAVTAQQPPAVAAVRAGN
jgi:hypothetical protein